MASTYEFEGTPFSPKQPAENVYFTIFLRTAHWEYWLALGVWDQGQEGDLVLELLSALVFLFVFLLLFFSFVLCACVILYKKGQYANCPLSWEFYQEFSQRVGPADHHPQPRRTPPVHAFMYWASS